MAKMSDVDLAALVDGWISDAKQFDTSDLSEQREKAIEFYDGKVDIESLPGHSSAVSSDLADVLEWILPGLLRVFTASDRVAVYEPREPDDEAGAKQATDGINFLFMTECDGFRILKDSMHDGLLHGNGIVKTWWAGEREYKTEVVRGLTEMEYEALISQPDVEEVIEETVYFVGPDGQQFDVQGEPMKEMGADAY